MKAEEFFKKLQEGGFEGEAVGIREIADYLSFPNGNKVYNTDSENYAKGIMEMVNSQMGLLEAKVFENQEIKRYQVGIFYKKSG